MLNNSAKVTRNLTTNNKECKRYRRCEGEELMPQDQWFGLLVKQSDPAKLRLFSPSISLYSP
jgi:hypothetical protein